MGEVVTSSALDAFRAQWEAVDQLHRRLTEIGKLLRSIQDQADDVTHNVALRDLLAAEQTWLDRAQRTIVEVRALREQEMGRFWPGVWRRWAVALVFALAAAGAAGAGYAWAARPYEVEVAALRSRVELLDSVAQRVLKMTPNERREFDALMKGSALMKR